MLKQYLKQLILALAALPLLVQPASAHVVWFDYQDGEYQLLFGHPEEGPEPITVSKFQSATGYDQNKQVVPVEVNTQDGISVTPQGDIAALTAFYDNGYWIQTSPDDYENISQEQAQAIGYQDVTNNLKYTKALYDWTEPVSQSFDLPLEIVPLENPLEVNVGETLPIQVLYQGNAIDNPLVEYKGETLNVNAEGVAYIPVGDDGLQTIEASYDEPTANGLVVSHATSLTAEKVPEPSALLGISAFGLLAFISKSRLKRSSSQVLIEK